MFSAPFAKDDYDQICDPSFKSETVIEVFGTWDEAINKAGLTKKFNGIKAIKAEQLDFNPEKEKSFSMLLLIISAVIYKFSIAISKTKS